MAFGWKPYGPNASLNRRTVAAEIGSLPLRTALTLDRSSGSSPSFGTPRAAAWSNAKFGATEMTPPVSSVFARHLADPAARPRTNAAGVMNVHVVADHRWASAR